MVGLDTVLSEAVLGVVIAFGAGVVVPMGVALEGRNLDSGAEDLILMTRLEISTGTLFFFVAKGGVVVLFDTAGTTGLSILTVEAMVDLSSGKEDFDLTTRRVTSVGGTSLPVAVVEPVEAASLESGTRPLTFINLAIAPFMLAGGVVVKASGSALSAFLDSSLVLVLVFVVGSPSRLGVSSVLRLAVVTVGGGRRPKKKFALSLGLGGEGAVLLVLFRVMVRFSTGEEVAGLILTLTLDLDLGVVDEEVAEVDLTTFRVVEAEGCLLVLLPVVVHLRMDSAGVLVSESAAGLVVEARDGFLLTKNLSRRIWTFGDGHDWMEVF